MRRQFILTALAGIIGIAACFASASAHDDDDDYDRSYKYRSYKEDWYRAYERRREATDRYRARHDARTYERYERYMANRWYRRDHHYQGDYRGYRHSYGYTPRTYTYFGNTDFADNGNYSYRIRQPNDHRWRPDDYPTGWKSWWLHMDREGRAGRN